MIPYPDNTPADRLASLPAALWRGLPRGYAVVFFSTDVRLGWALLVLSLTVPAVGLAGLGGALLAGLVAWGLGFDRAGIRSGFQLFNPMLACSALALLHSGREVPPAVMIPLWAGASVLALLLTVSMQPWFGGRSGLSVQSLPAVITVSLLHFAASALDGGWPWLAPGELSPIAGWLQPGGWLGPMFESFGAMVFHPLAWVGIALFTALALSSPLGALMAAVGWLAGTATLVLLGQPVAQAGGAAVGFNFLLTGIALGAGYHVPNRSSLLLAGFGASLCALIAVGLGAALGRFGLAPGALPFNGAVLLLVYALRQWPRSAGLEPSPLGTLLPESAARLVQLDARRFPHLHAPALFLPVDSERLITQGFDGELTHRGSWRHGLDFEGTARPPGAVDDCGSFPVFGTPVHAPCSGTVVSLANHVADNRPGTNNPEDNWGNHLVIRADAGFHVLLAHLRQGSLTVTEGQRVLAGAVVGSCGNSGRSPLPHLHVQAQQGPLPGEPTIPFVLKHWVRCEGGEGGGEYLLSGVPDQGMRIRPVVPSSVLHAALAGWLPGEYRFELRRGGDLIEESLRLDFDEAGRFRLRTFGGVGGVGELRFFFAEGVFYATGLDARGSRVLPLLATVMARIPCIADEQVEWRDWVPLAPWCVGARRWLHRLLDPFVDVAVLGYRYRVAADSGAFLLKVKLEPASGGSPPPGAALRHAEARLVPRSGVVGVTGDCCDGRPFRLRLSSYHPLGLGRRAKTGETVAELAEVGR